MAGRSKERSRHGNGSLLEDGVFAIRPPCVLVAEDDLDIRAVVVAALRRDGYDVIEAKTGAQLLEHIASSMLFGKSYPPPDVIVTDLRMPGFSGLEVLAGLRDANWRTPVLVMTAYGTDETRDQCVRLGALVMDKPFDIDQLRMTVADLVPLEAWRRCAPDTRN